MVSRSVKVQGRPNKMLDGKSGYVETDGADAFSNSARKEPAIFMNSRPTGLS